MLDDLMKRELDTKQKHVNVAAEEPVGGDWLLAALIAYFFIMLIFVCVDSPAVWQNSWRGLDCLVAPQQRTF